MRSAQPSSLSGAGAGAAVSSSSSSLDVHQRLENIRLILHTFKLEQEQLILKFNDEYKFRLNRPSTLLSPMSVNPGSSNPNPQFQFYHQKNGGGGFLQPPNQQKDTSKANEIPKEIQSSDTALLVPKLINVDCIVMPMGNDLFSNQRLWPQALIAHYRDMIGKVNNIESHGSLWKLIPRKDSAPGQRVLFQSAEIGEEPKYLSARLELVDLKADAAIWNMKILDLPRAPEEGNNFQSNDSTKGIPVSFELAGGIITENTANPEMIEVPKEGSLLVCSFSRLSTTSELQLLTKQDLRNLENSDEYQAYSSIWEICPESWINDDLEFLDRYLS